MALAGRGPDGCIRMQEANRPGTKGYGQWWDGAPITRDEVDKYYHTQLNPDAPPAFARRSALAQAECPR